MPRERPNEAEKPKKGTTALKTTRSVAAKTPTHAGPYLLPTRRPGSSASASNPEARDERDPRPQAPPRSRTGTLSIPNERLVNPMQAPRRAHTKSTSVATPRPVDPRQSRPTHTKTASNRPSTNTPHMTPSAANEPRPVKSATQQISRLSFHTLKTTAPQPLWKEQDNAHDEHLQSASNKRTREPINERIRRIGGRTVAKKVAANVNDPEEDEVGRRVAKKVFLGPNLELVRDGERLDSEMDTTSSDGDNLPPPQASPSPSPSPRPLGQVARKTAMKMAARKTKLPSSDEESKSSSSSEDEESSEEDEEDETEQEFEVKEEEDDDDWGFGRLRPFGPPELIDLATPPQITVSLPQISQQYHTEAARGEAPPGLVLEALDLFIRPEVHMHHYGRLPFKTKNLRRGFLLRCVEFGISIARQPFTSVSVTYEVARTGKNYVAALSDWCCPLCSYHGAFPSRLPLERHLIVDHRDVLAEWKVQPDNSWTLKITLPDPKTPRRIIQPIVKQEPVEPVLHDESMQDDVHPGDRTMFPFVTLSPPSTIERSRTATSATTPSRPPTTPRSSATPSTSTLFSGTTPHDEDEDIKPFSAFRSQSTITASSSSRQSLAPSSSSRQSLAASSSRQSLAASSSSGWTSTTIPSSSSSASRSSVATTVTTTTTTTTHITASTSLATPTPIFPDGRDYPPPPPPDDPLGPAARPPYLPAHSDYGGPTVYYSVRPCGETLFDLLGTLPLDDFGLLAWAVLDKEEEIFESDDVKDEHKVMLALWGRWIMLNRTDFITDYPKGVRHFIDQYWKMIHRAAGWDALRYLLLLLLANRYLSAKEVAQSLKYYEEYTGMEHWAPP